MRRLPSLAVFALVGSTLATPAMAQRARPNTAASPNPVPAPRPITVGVSAGSVIPLGDFGESTSPGVHLGLHAQYRFGRSRYSLRGAVHMDRNEIDAISGDDPDLGPFRISGHTRMVGESVTGVADLPRLGQFLPYVLAGVGIYNVRYQLDADFTSSKKQSVHDDETKPGYIGGLGVRIPLTKLTVLFAEVRYQTILTGGGRIDMVPVVLGISY